MTSVSQNFPKTDGNKAKSDSLLRIESNLLMIKCHVPRRACIAQTNHMCAHSQFYGILAYLVAKKFTFR